MRRDRSTILGAWLVVAAVCPLVSQAETTWRIDEGYTVVTFDGVRLHELGLTVSDGSMAGAARISGVAQTYEFAVDGDSTLSFTTERGLPRYSLGGEVGHVLRLRFTSADGKWSDASLTLGIAEGTFDAESLADAGVSTRGEPGLELRRMKAAVDAVAQRLLIEGLHVAISKELATALGRPELVDEVIGSFESEIGLEWTGGDDPLEPIGDEDGGLRTDCGRPGGPDVIVGELIDITNYSSLDGIEAFAVGTTSCNVGDENLLWISSTNEHPVIGQHMYRLKDDRFEQIGLSWLKHGFTALTQDACGCGCSGEGGSVLGVGCSDPYCCGLNGNQNRLGPRSEVNAYTGYFDYPWILRGDEGDCGSSCTSTYKRLQVHITDLDPDQDGGGEYFVEGHYVTADDALAGHGENNASYRPITISGSGSAWDASLAGTTQREQAAVRAWQDTDPSVVETDIHIPDEGLLILAAKATDLGGGMYHYEYALQNLNSDRSVGSFSVPVGTDAVVENIGFHDVDYHSGEPWDGTDWPTTFVGGTLGWATQDHDENPDANALRWGTIYNFRFDADAPPTTTTVTLGLFRPGTPSQVTAEILGPATGPLDCNENGIPDDQDIAEGRSQDCNGNGIPDECETFLPQPMKAVEIASGLSQPVGVYAAPEDDSGRLFIIEQGGRIKIWQGGEVQVTPFLDVSGLISAGGERGLLGLAFHPDYNTNGQFYINYTNTSGNTVIAEYLVSEDPDVADPSSAVILKTIVQDFANHNGGNLVFGRDGMLYVGMGDGGSGGDPNNRAQNPQSLLGKMLRLDVDAGPDYIPADNPFVDDPTTLDEIWALGVRNPWRFSFDRLTGDLYIGDVGQNAHEEIDFQPADSTGGENYGWRCYEGDFEYNPSGCEGPEAYVFPIKDVPHTGGVCSITGGFVYRGCAMPELSGTYFYSDYCADRIWTFRYVDGEVTDEQDVTAELTSETGTIPAVVSFGEDNDGELYFVSLAGGVYKIVPDVSGPVCGNGVIEEGEQCDPPDGMTCDDQCQFIECTVQMFEDHFESDLGWTVENIDLTDGAWERGVPAGDGSRGDPTEDFDGSGQCYLTGNRLGNSDVDGGPTILTSPTIDLSADDITLRYAYWYYNDDDDPEDYLRVEVSTDDGDTWVEVALHQESMQQWRTNSVFLDDFVTPTSGTRIRFTTIDNPNDTVLEAAVDAILIRRECDDCNNNGVDDEQDIADGTSQDCNGNGIPDECDTAPGGASEDCDGGVVGVIEDGATLFGIWCFGCHNDDGSGGPEFPGPDIRNKSRREIWTKLLPPTDHPGGAHPEFTDQDFANLEAFLADFGSRGRPDRIPDECQDLEDCNSNGIADGCDLEAGTMVDLDYDGIPDQCQALIGDIDNNGAVDLVDYALFASCIMGPEQPGPPPNCLPEWWQRSDIDNDDDVDEGDFSVFQEVFPTN